MGIDLGGFDVCMTQQLLHRAQILRRLQQVAGKRMAQHMWMQVLAQLALARRLDPSLNRPRTQALTALADENGIILGVGQGAQG